MAVAAQNHLSRSTWRRSRVHSEFANWHGFAVGVGAFALGYLVSGGVLRPLDLWSEALVVAVAFALLAAAVRCLRQSSSWPNIVGLMLASITAFLLGFPLVLRLLYLVLR